MAHTNGVGGIGIGCWLDMDGCGLRAVCVWILGLRLRLYCGEIVARLLDLPCRCQEKKEMKRKGRPVGAIHSLYRLVLLASCAER
jgi:hypothetical protein